MSSEYALRKVKASKTHWCVSEWAHDRRINPGDECYVYTDFPSSDLGYATMAGRPVQWRLCSHCGSLCSQGLPMIDMESLS